MRQSVRSVLSNTALRCSIGLLTLVLSGPMAFGAENIATGARINFSKPPLYDLTADSEDASQLTDGETVDGTMWMSRHAVGWLTGREPVRIDIDLGRVQAIGDVCLHTSRRSEAGVYFPARVDVFAAVEPAVFAWGGRMTPFAEAGSGEYLAREFCLKGIGLPARYVSLLVAVIEGHFFTDEISITAGDKSVAPDRLSLIAESDQREFALQHEAITRSLAEVRARLPADRDILDRFEALAASLDGPAGTLDLTVLRARDLELRDIVRAARERAGVPFTAAFSDPWAPATPFDGKRLANRPGVLEIAAGQHGAVAIAIEHAAPREEEMTVLAVVAGDGTEQVEVKLFEVGMVTRADGVRLGDALLPMSNGRLSVPAGVTRQLWVDIAAGAVTRELNLTLALRVRTASGAERTLSRPILIYPLRDVSKPPFTVVWGYLDQLPIRGRPREASLDMQAHGVTSAVIPAGDLPWPEPDAGGEMAANVYRTYANVMQHLEGHDAFLFFLSLNEDSGYRERLGTDFMSDRWRKAFAIWIGEWSSMLKREGIDPARYAFYPVDEPDTPADLETLTMVSRLIKSIDPAFRIYTTLHDPAGLTDEVIDAVDVFQLNGLALAPEVIERLKSRGKTVASYATSGGGKAGAPGPLYRAQGWRAFVSGLDGFGFWSYADTGVSGTAWNDIDDVEPDYAVVYEGKRGIVSSKRWEAWREGVQDYHLLSAAWQAASSEATKSLVLELAHQAEARGYATAGLSELRTRLRLIAATGNDVLQ